MNSRKKDKQTKVKIVRKPNQSVERTISMFNKRCQRRRIAPEVNGNKFFTKPLNKNKRRTKAIKREENRAKRERAQYR